MAAGRQARKRPVPAMHTRDGGLGVWRTQHARPGDPDSRAGALEWLRGWRRSARLDFSMLHHDQSTMYSLPAPAPSVAVTQASPTSPPPSGAPGCCLGHSLPECLQPSDGGLPPAACLKGAFATAHPLLVTDSTRRPASRGLFLPPRASAQGASPHALIHCVSVHPSDVRCTRR